MARKYIVFIVDTENVGSNVDGAQAKKKKRTSYDVVIDRNYRYAR